MKKMPITKRISVTMRGFSILKQYCPGLAQGKAAYELINSIQPFVSIWFAARIVNEISSQRRFNTILLYVLGTVLINFICALLKSIINHVCNEKESQMWSWFGKVFSDRCLLILLIWKMSQYSIRDRKQKKTFTCSVTVWHSSSGGYPHLYELSYI